MNKLTIGVIGAGRIGKLHVANIKQYFPSIHIKLIADPYPDKTWLKNNPALNSTQNIEEIFADKEIDAVLICSPAQQHVPQIIAAARTGKHIFCEKPIATDVA